MLLAHRIAVSELTHRLERAAQGRSFEESNVRRWAAPGGPWPTPSNAWLIGEALRLDDPTSEAIRGSSGLLALYWFGRFSDFVGVIGCTDANALLINDYRFMAMLRTIEMTRWISPFDFLPPQHDVFIDATEERLRQIIAAGTHAFPLDMDIEREARALNYRRKAMMVWEMPTDLHGAVSNGALRWFGTFKSDRSKSGVKYDGTLFRGQPRMLREAYEVAAAKMHPLIRLNLVIDRLSAWLYTLGNPEPFPEADFDMWASIVTDPESYSASAARVAARSYQLLADEVAENIDELQEQ